MVKRTETIRRLLPMSCLNVFKYFVGLARKGLMFYSLILLYVFVSCAVSLTDRAT